MKINKKALRLIDKGLSANTVSKLDESQINILHSKLFLSEQVQEMPAKKSYKVGQEGGNLPPSPKGYNVKKTPTGDVVATPNESELEEDVEVTTDPNKETETQDPHQVGPSTDDGYNDYGDGMPTESQMTEGKKKTKDNAWAICTSQVGKQFKTTERSERSAKQKNKYERCVKDVKQSLKEGKDPYISLIEKEIVSLVEKNLQPKMTKGDFMKMLSEQPTTAPTKPDVKPGVKPGTKPRTRPAHPGKNPNPGENPAPKAADKEKAKEDVIQVIMKLLKNGK